MGRDNLGAGFRQAIPQQQIEEPTEKIEKTVTRIPAEQGLCKWNQIMLFESLAFSTANRIHSV